MKLIPLDEQSMLSTRLSLPKERTTHGSRLITETWREIQVSSTEEAKEKIEMIQRNYNKRYIFKNTVEKI